MTGNKISNEQASMIVKFFNAQAKTAIRSGNIWNQRKVIETAERTGADIADIKNHIRAWVKDNAGDKDFYECLDAMPVKKAVPQAPQVQATVSDAQVNYSMGILEQAVVSLISNMKADEIKAQIMGSVEDKVRAFIRDEYGTIERKIVTVVDGKRVPMQGIQHDKFETVLKFVANNEPVFLTGPAGSGKNVICKQVAEALELDFYFTNAVTQEYQLKGFTDAMGNYHETQFYKAFKNGGLFMLDEIDASIPEVLVILNAAIANRYFDFPAPIGYVEAHPNFRVIAAGNTTGHGADYSYVGRNQLDAASLNRFGMIRINYSEAIENSVACGDIDLANFCRDYRKSALKAGLNIVVSYRDISRLAKMTQLLDLEEALDTCLVKGLDKDDINIIIKGMTRGSKYKTALENLVKSI